MAIYWIINAVTWPHIELLVNYLRECRSKNEVTESLRIGMNHCIILYSACYVEGILESGLKAVIRQKRDVFNKVEISDFYTRKTVNTLFTALETDVIRRVSRTTGMPNYDEIFKLLTGQRISDKPKVQPLWEGIQTLFQFRNVLAHSREVSTTLLQAYWIPEEWREEFSGGYKKAEDYLLKCNLVKSKFSDCKSLSTFFTDKVADHFWKLAKELVIGISDSIPEDVKSAFDAVLLNSDDENVNN